MYTGSPIYQHRSYLQSSHFFYNLIEEHEKNYPHYHTKNYRYAFNGMEQDKEVSGNGNSYTTQFRQYDPRLGRWKSLDPLAAKYASITPYAGMGNNPMFYNDPLGLEPNGGGGKWKRKRKNRAGKLSKPKKGEKKQNEGESESDSDDGSDTSKNDTSKSESRSETPKQGDKSTVKRVVISIEGNKDYNGPSGDGSTWIIETDDIKKANDLYKEKFGNEKVSTIIINTHAGGDNGYTTTGREGLVTSNVDRGKDTRINRNIISEAEAQRRINATVEEYLDATAFNSLVKMVSDGGTCVITGCNAGNDSHLISTIAWLAGKDVTVYANRDFTNAVINSDKAYFWTGDDEYRGGWVVYDPSKKFRKFRHLKTKDNPGRLYFLYGKDFNYEGSSPPVFSLNK